MNTGSPDSDQERMFDWEGARKRIDTIRTALAEMGETSPEVLERIWAQRAAQLAQLPVSEEIGEQVQLVAIRLGREVYGVEAVYVLGIRPAEQITRVPRVPDWVAGVANVSGRTLSVIDLARFLGLETNEQPEDARDDPPTTCLVIVQTPEMEVALLADDVIGVETVPTSRVKEATDTIRTIRPEYIRGVAELESQEAWAGEDRLVVVLDLAALLADEQLIVQDEVT